MEVSGLNGFNIQNGLSSNTKAFQIGKPLVSVRNESKEIKEQLESNKVTTSQTDISGLSSFLGGFGEFGKFLKSIKGYSDHLSALAEKGKELLRPEQRKAIDSEIESARLEVQRIITSKKSPIEKVKEVVSRVKEMMQQGKTGKEIASSLGEYRSLMGDKFFELIEKSPTKAINLLSGGLGALSKLGNDKMISNEDFSKNLKQITNDILSALNNSGGLDDGELYQPLVQIVSNQMKDVLKGKQLNIWV
jgi:hypothetical protein